MSVNLWRVFSVAVCVSVTILAIGCGGASSAPISGYNALGAVSVTITPATMIVGTSTTETFTAVVNNSGLQTVQWQVNGFPGGAAEIGTIDNSGNYTAPQFVPIPSRVTITAVANADTTKSGTATVTISGSLVPAQVFISPSGTAYVQAGHPLKLSGGVIGPANTAVDWQVNGIANGNSVFGTVTSGAGNTAVYTAPAKVPNSSTVTIKALSHVEPSKFTYCKVTLSEQAPTIATVTVTPAVAVDQTQSHFTFTADVINADDDSVSWEVAGVDGNPTYGGSEVNGTIGSENGNTGVYTAPSEVPPLGNVVSVIAVSNAQPTRNGFASLTVTPPPPLGVAVLVNGTGTVLEGGIAHYNATVQNANVQTVTWQVNGVTGGNSTYGTISPDPVIPDQGDYTAPATVPQPPVVIVGAVPTVNPKIAGTLPVTISTPNISASVVCYPNTCLNGTEQLGIGQTQQFQLQVSGSNNQTGTWYVCSKTSDPSNCVFGGNATLGTIVPPQGSNLVTYTAPASVPSPATVIIKAVPAADPSHFAVATVTISLNAVSVQVMPPGPLTVQTGELGGPFTATVVGSTDQVVSWYVNNILNGDSTVGTMMPDSQNLNEEDYIAPVNVPNPATVVITAVPEADPSVVSNKVMVTIIPVQNQITITISPDPPPPMLPGQSNPNYDATVNNSSDQVVYWTLAPTSGGTCTTGLPTPCGTINPSTTNGQPTTYTAPDVQGLPDPYYVNITATADANSNVKATVTQEITANAQASISISPGSLAIQAGSTSQVPFMVVPFNIPDFDQVTVNWSMSCNSLAPPGENCGKEPFGQFADKGGPGCFNPEDGGMKVCNDNSFDDLGGVSPVYAAPGVLGSSYMAVPECNTQPGQTDGFVAVTAVVTSENCPGSLMQCTATMCIDVSPPAPEKHSLDHDSGSAP
ncbi:MAG: hypothetical protein WAL32_11025 [Terriglobales bacterium]